MAEEPSKDNYDRMKQKYTGMLSYICRTTVKKHRFSSMSQASPRRRKSGLAASVGGNFCPLSEEDKESILTPTELSERNYRQKSLEKHSNVSSDPLAYKAFQNGKIANITTQSVESEDGNSFMKNEIQNYVEEEMDSYTKHNQQNFSRLRRNEKSGINT